MGIQSRAVDTGGAEATMASVLRLVAVGEARGPRNFTRTAAIA